MKVRISNVKNAAGIALGLSLALSPFIAAADTAPTFSTSEVTANVSPANTQTLATSTVTANVAQTKASRTLTVVSVPVATVGSTTATTIGACVVTYSTTTPDSLNCSGNAAVLNVTTHASTAGVAATLGSLTNVSGTVHGPLTATSSGSTATFTTAGNEASTTAVSFVDNTSNTVQSSSSTSGVVAVAQVFSLIPGSIEYGDSFNARVNSSYVTYTATATTSANVLAGLTLAINGSSASTSVTASNTGSQVNVTAIASGTPFTLTASTTNASPVAQMVTFTPTDPDKGDTFSLMVNGSTYSHIFELNDTLQSLVENLSAQLTAATSSVACSENDVAVSCTSASAGTSFTYSASVIDFASTTVSSSGGGGHHGSGGGGGSSHSSTSSTVTVGTGSTPAVTTTTTVNTGTTMPSSPAMVSTWPDMTMGAKGANVMALQTWLMAKGYSIPAGATGFFGAQTTAAVAAYQKANGIMPSVGYFGPKTRAFIAAHP